MSTTKRKGTFPAEDYTPVVRGAIIHAINNGLPCPSNDELAERLGLTPRQISRALFKIKSYGGVVIEFTEDRRRVAVDSATGRRTEPSISNRGYRPPVAYYPPSNGGKALVVDGVVRQVEAHGAQLTASKERFEDARVRPARVIDCRGWSTMEHSFGVPSYGR